METERVIYNSVHTKLLVEYREIFDDTPKELKSYLTGIQRSLLLNAAAFFLGFSNRGSKYDKYENVLSLFFRRENQAFANAVYQKLKRLEKNRELIIINHRSSLELFEFVHSNILEDIQVQSEAYAEINLFKAYLLINQQFATKEKLAFDSCAALPEGLKLSAIHFSQSYPYSDLLNYDLNQLTCCQLIKAMMLFEFLEANHKLLLQKFLDYYGCATWIEYCKKFFPLISPISKKEREAHTDILVTHDVNYKAHCDFIDKLIISPSELISEDFKALRSAPLYKVEEGKYRIIYDLFIAEKIYKGLYFKLSEINDTLGTQKIKNLRSFYTTEFSEKYLFYSSLNNIYKDRYIKFTGEEILKLGIKAEPDYYIRNKKNIFLFESKDIFINAAIKPTFDFAQYEVELKKKLYSDGKENKAILQLINNIKRSLRKEFPFDTNYDSNTVNIYPIIILYDHQFNTAGLNAIINYWFQLELLKLKDEGTNIECVRPVVIIDIDTLVFHQDILQDGTILLETVLDEYFKSLVFDTKKVYQNFEDVKAHQTKTCIPFSHFLDNYTIERKIRRVPKILMAKGLTLFKPSHAN